MSETEPGKRQAVRRQVHTSTIVVCQNCQRVFDADNLAPTKALDRSGWWRSDQHAVLCDDCYVAKEEDRD